MAGTRTSTEQTVLQKFYRDYLNGSHILHYHNVLDAFGHLSFRHPLNPNIFIMSRNAAPATISSPNDLIEYYVEDSKPVDPNAAAGFLERHIHSECYKRYPGVRSVIHSHSEAVVPYTFSGVPLRACYHMAGFLGLEVPVWDIEDAQRPGDISDLLVRNVHLGSSLANSFAGSKQDGNDLPQHTVVLMRGHGFTVLAGNMEECVMRAVYTQKNAMIQTTALMTRAADLQTDKASKAIKYLSQKEVDDTTWSIPQSAHRPWKLWLREVEACNLYVNSA
ncbi:uncharacterized protein A1O5_08539 [Cladophialophora psammophila CBS 110553]|uniref:Class II aldolase/adducin N-terminal domain-containing protein n=1 Tax=Cladophialophora psammophila CBS 110553 TaxID=1182543 RepID=W9WUL5_9EURO|nr:uncharacterized protein A1O5_08539 [Cladophialophora psammophila CBS 110553]EXJ68745.1 hypothetical protein A1O5_08539 [Cladophialophora psammophila CBS 110553]